MAYDNFLFAFCFQTSVDRLGFKVSLIASSSSSQSMRGYNCEPSPPQTPLLSNKPILLYDSYRFTVRHTL